MSDAAPAAEDRWLAMRAAMDTPEARSAAMSGTVEEWATESLLAARSAYQDPATGQRMKPGAKLAESFQARSRPVARRRSRGDRDHPSFSSERGAAA